MFTSRNEELDVGTMFDNGVTDDIVFIQEQEAVTEVKETGSSVAGATLNFTNAIIGAGALGLGGAIAASGGFVSIVALVAFAVAAKMSNDMIIGLTVLVESAEPGGHGAITYEKLGQLAYGMMGMFAVLISKSFYSFGCLVAYVIVIKDNFGSGLEGVIYGNAAPAPTDEEDWFRRLLQNETLLAVVLSTVVILPLCFFRDISPLAKFSFLSILSMLAIVGIVIYLFAANPGGDIRVESSGGFVNDWLVIRPGIFASLGTFVFTFVAQHTVHITYESMAPQYQTLRAWKRVSLYSILISGTVSLTVGLFVYMTFWQETKSDIFELYPPSGAIDAAKIFLSVSMLLTFPLPFCTCREMIVVMLSNLCRGCRRRRRRTDDPGELGLRESLLYEEGLSFGDSAPRGGGELKDSSSLSFAFGDLPEEEYGDLSSPRSSRSFLLEGDDRQLILPCHAILTLLLWGLTTAVAVTAPSLGDILDVVGCLSGTVIAFILPGLFTIKLEGCSRLAVGMVVIGVVVGSVGTYFSLQKLVLDMME